MASHAVSDDYAATAVEWLTCDQGFVEGLDHLGVQLVSAGIYAQLVPGVSNVTDRARYFSFHPWVLHSFVQGAADRTPDGWRRWIRRHEYVYSLAAAAAEHAKIINKAGAGGMIGATRSRTAVKASEVDIDVATRLDHHGKAVKGHYFKNPQGGYAQYYKGQLTMLGVLRRDDEHRDPDRRLTHYAGVKLAEAVEQIEAFRELRAIARAGEKVSFRELEALGRVVHPAQIDPDGLEARLLCGLLLGDDDELCAGQSDATRNHRRQSLALALHYLTHKDPGQSSESEWGFRWCVLASQTHGGRPWQPPASLRACALAWAAYAQNELLNYALECFLWSALQVLDAEPRAPRELAALLAAAACSELPDAAALQPGLADAVAAHRRLTARPLYDALWAARSPEEKAARAARLLLHVAADRQRYAGAAPLATIPGGDEILKTREIHLQSYWQRIDAAGNTSTEEFLARLVLEWVLYRHLRVATRKLASQHDFTFRFRPEEGRLVKCGEIEPTFTNPRLIQAIRMMADVGLVSQDLATISPHGRSLLDAYP